MCCRSLSVGELGPHISSNVSVLLGFSPLSATGTLFALCHRGVTVLVFLCISLNSVSAGLQSDMECSRRCTSGSRNDFSSAFKPHCCSSARNSPIDCDTSASSPDTSSLGYLNSSSPVLSPMLPQPSAPIPMWEPSRGSAGKPRARIRRKAPRDAPPALSPDLSIQLLPDSLIVLKVPMLKTLAQRFGLKYGGTKAQLIQRLVDYGVCQQASGALTAALPSTLPRSSARSDRDLASSTPVTDPSTAGCSTSAKPFPFHPSLVGPYSHYSCVCRGTTLTWPGPTVCCSRCNIDLHERCMLWDSQQAAANSVSFLCPKCRLETMDPFYPSCQLLWMTYIHSSMPEATFVEPDGTYCMPASFNLFAGDLHSWRRNNKHVIVRCVRIRTPSTANQHLVHEWPRTIVIKINDNAESIAVPRPDHKRRDSPMFVAHYLRPEHNSVEVVAWDMSPSDHPEDAPVYALGFFLCDFWDVYKLTDVIRQRTTDTYDDGVQRVTSLLNKVVDDEDISCVEQSQTFKLICPITLTRMTLPARGHNCKHLQCFDLESFIGVTKCSKAFNNRWKCPECPLIVRPDTLLVDPFVAHILEETRNRPGDIVEVSPGGQWTLLPPSTSSRFPRLLESTVDQDQPSFKQENVDANQHDALDDDDSYGPSDGFDNQGVSLRDPWQPPSPISIDDSDTEEDAVACLDGLPLSAPLQVVSSPIQRKAHGSDASAPLKASVVSSSGLSTKQKIQYLASSAKRRQFQPQEDAAAASFASSPSVHCNSELYENQLRLVNKRNFQSLVSSLLSESSPIRSQSTSVLDRTCAPGGVITSSLCSPEYVDLSTSTDDEDVLPVHSRSAPKATSSFTHHTVTHAKRPASATSTPSLTSRTHQNQNSSSSATNSCADSGGVLHSRSTQLSSSRTVSTGHSSSSRVSKKRKQVSVHKLRAHTSSHEPSFSASTPVGQSTASSPTFAESAMSTDVLPSSICPNPFPSECDNTLYQSEDLHPDTTIATVNDPCCSPRRAVNDRPVTLNTSYNSYNSEDIFVQEAAKLLLSICPWTSSSLTQSASRNASLVTPDTMEWNPTKNCEHGLVVSPDNSPSCSSRPLSPATVTSQIIPEQTVALSSGNERPTTYRLDGLEASYASSQPPVETDDNLFPPHTKDCASSSISPSLLCSTEPQPCQTRPSSSPTYTYLPSDSLLTADTTTCSPSTPLSSYPVVSSTPLTTDANAGNPAQLLSFSYHSVPCSNATRQVSAETDENTVHSSGVQAPLQQLSSSSSHQRHYFQSSSSSLACSSYPAKAASLFTPLPCPPSSLELHQGSAAVSHSSPLPMISPILSPISSDRSLPQQDNTHAPYRLTGRYPFCPDTNRTQDMLPTPIEPSSRHMFLRLSPHPHPL